MIEIKELRSLPSITIWNSVPVVTTKQIAEIYGTSARQVSNNFNHNKEKYTEGKHYFCLKNDELKEFKTSHENDDLLKSNAKLVYLWTERGALLLAKSINTDVAWEAYERLVDFYFEKKQEQTPNKIDDLVKTEYHTSSTQIPQTPSWFSRNNNRMKFICDVAHATRRDLYHHILDRLGEEYDICAANRIYRMELGYPPRYAIDIVSYFPQLAKLADEFLDKLENCAKEELKKRAGNK